MTKRKMINLYLFIIYYFNSLIKEFILTSKGEKLFSFLQANEDGDFLAFKAD